MRNPCLGDWGSRVQISPLRPKTSIKLGILGAGLSSSAPVSFANVWLLEAMMDPPTIEGAIPPMDFVSTGTMLSA